MRPLALLLVLACALASPGLATAEGHGKKVQSSYMPLRPVVLTIVRPTGGRGALTVDLGLYAPDPGLRERIAASGPLLRDAYISALQPYGMRLGPGAPPNLELIGSVLQRETDRVLGAKGARVLLGAVIVN